MILEDCLGAWVFAPGRAARAVAAALSGNYDARDSRVLRALRFCQRLALLSGSVFVSWLTTLSGETNWLWEPIGILQFGVWVTIPWIVMSVDGRTRDPQCKLLLQSATRACASTPRDLAEALARGCFELVLVSIFFAMALMRAALFAAEPRVGAALAAASFLPFVVVIMGLCDMAFKAGTWVAASKSAIQGFGDDVARTICAGTGRGLPTRQVSMLNGRSSSKDSDGRPGSVFATEFRQRSISTGSTSVDSIGPLTIDAFASAYDEAASVVTTMNSIFSGPITASFLVMLALIPIYYQKGTEAASGVYVGFAAATALMGISTLSWLASVGDTSIRVSRILLSPHCFLILARSLNRQDPTMGDHLREALQSTVLGFEVYNVTMTSQKVVYLVGTLMCALLISFAPLWYTQAM